MDHRLRTLPDLVKLRVEQKSVHNCMLNEKSYILNELHRFPYHLENRDSVFEESSVSMRKIEIFMIPQCYIYNVESMTVSYHIILAVDTIML